MSEGRVEAIFIGPEPQGPMTSVPSVNAVAGKGLEGDRYFMGLGTFYKEPDPSREITLFEREALDAVEREEAMRIEPSETRRNVMTSGVALNHLVGREFRVGGARLRGIRLAEPCGHLAELTGKALVRPLLHRAGLRAEILQDGTISVGDAVTPA